MADQPVLGSLAWMNYTMRSVHPVYDGSQLAQAGFILASDSGITLTADDGTTVLTTEDFSQTVIGQLVRWI